MIFNSFKFSVVLSTVTKLLKTVDLLWLNEAVNKLIVKVPILNVKRRKTITNRFRKTSHYFPYNIVNFKSNLQYFDLINMC